MNKFLLLAAFFLAIASCKKETATYPLTVSVKCKNTALYSFQPLVTGATVYLFDNINFNLPTIGTWDYVGSGQLKNKASGALVSYSKIVKSSSSGVVVFDGLSGSLYSVVADISSVTKIKRGANDWAGSSINPTTSSSLDLVFDIWPYSMTDLGL